MSKVEANKLIMHFCLSLNKTRKIKDFDEIFNLLTSLQEAQG